jgi:FMN-dependent NADH-azoreductase
MSGCCKYSNGHSVFQHDPQNFLARVTTINLSEEILYRSLNSNDIPYISNTKIQHIKTSFVAYDSRTQNKIMSHKMS